MHQMIEGIDNEVTFIILFITLLLAIVIPLYIMKPNRNNGDTEQQQNDGNNSNSPQEPANEVPQSMQMPQPETGQSTTQRFVNDNYQRENRPVDPNIQSSGEETRETHEQTISVRVLHQETYHQMNVSNNMKLKDFKEACFPEEFAAEKSIRMIYAGKILQGDSFPLRYLGIMNNSVIHCVISEHSSTNSSNNNPSNNEPANLDMSDYLMHLVGLSLVGTWTIFIIWTNLMSSMSIAILIFLTVFFIGWTFYS